MRFCSYARKSVFSDKSDSIETQFEMSKDYVETRFPGQVEFWVQYSDEDFTGANTNRPELQRMLNDIKDGLYDALVVYRLDRLSRDVRDFSNIYAMLEEHGVMFISIKENIDTTTPIGKAMMYVSVVFAQMERETIASRVTDNMIGLSKKGYWIGGNPPIGYVREHIVVNGKKHVTLSPDPEGVKYVMWIADTFLENNYSLQSMETAFRKQGVRTRNGAFFSTTQLHSILTMPFCAEATVDVYDYYASKGCQMSPDSPREKWDGSHGVMIYGRTTEKNKKHEKQPPEKWIISLGMHKPFMPAEKWLTIQSRFSQNKFDKTMKYDIPLLKGVLRCSCGSIMNVSRKKKINGGVSSWYYCLKRMRRGTEVCERSQIKIELLDNKVLEILRSIALDPMQIYRFVHDDSNAKNTPDSKEIKRKIVSCESKIERLASSLAFAESSAASKYIIAEIERLDLELHALKREYNIALSSDRARASSVKTAESKAKEIANLIQGLDGFTAEEKNDIIRKVVSKCVWDGKELFISF